MEQLQVRKLVEQIVSAIRQRSIPIGVSSRHVHLSRDDYRRLFPHQPLTVKKALLQPGQFAAQQMVTLCGPKGELHKVRVLGPLRAQSQVEISRTDARTLGIEAPLRLSGELRHSAGVVLRSETAEIALESGAIVARRHIHMSPLDAQIYRVRHGEVVRVAIESGERRLIFDDVWVRVADDMRLELHIDTDEANAAGIDGQASARLLTKEA